MKKICLLAILSVLLLLLSVSASAEAGWISKAELTDDEWNLLQLLGMDEAEPPYDFKAPDGAKYLTLIVWQMQDGQWKELLRNAAELLEPSDQVKLEVTVWQKEDGSWEAGVDQPNAAGEQPDGRIYVDAPDILSGCRISIQQGDAFETRGCYPEEELDASGLNGWRRTFLLPEKDRNIKERVEAALNEQVVLQLYGYQANSSLDCPAISEFADPGAFASCEYAFAVTAIFTTEPLAK